MIDNEVENRYTTALQREQASRDTLRRAVATVRGAKEYDIRAMLAKEAAREVLDKTGNGLSPSEEAQWSDRLSNAERYSKPVFD